VKIRDACFPYVFPGVPGGGRTQQIRLDPDNTRHKQWPIAYSITKSYRVELCQPYLIYFEGCRGSYAMSFLLPLEAWSTPGSPCEDLNPLCVRGLCSCNDMSVQVEKKSALYRCYVKITKVAPPRLDLVRSAKGRARKD
jgi:hypothetical protein